MTLDEIKTNMAEELAEMIADALECQAEEEADYLSAELEGFEDLSEIAQNEIIREAVAKWQDYL